MTDRVEFLSQHQAIGNVETSKIDSIFCGKPTDPDLITVVLKDGNRLYCDEISFIDSMEEEPKAKFKVGDTVRFKNAKGLYLTRKITKIERTEGYNPIYYFVDGSIYLIDEDELELVEEPVSEELEELINNLSKRYPEVSFAKLSRIAVHVAKWQKEKMMEEAVKCEVKADEDGLFTTEKWDEMNDLLHKIGAKDGDKVKLITIKED